jgi:hypothetical protein
VGSGSPHLGFGRLEGALRVDEVAQLRLPAVCPCGRSQPGNRQPLSRNRSASRMCGGNGRPTAGPRRRRMRAPQRSSCRAAPRRPPPLLASMNHTPHKCSLAPAKTPSSAREHASRDAEALHTPRCDFPDRHRIDSGHGPSLPDGVSCGGGAGGFNDRWRTTLLRKATRNSSAISAGMMR